MDIAYRKMLQFVIVLIVQAGGTKEVKLPFCSVYEPQNRREENREAELVSRFTTV